MTMTHSNPIRVAVVARSIRLCRAMSQALSQGGIEVAASAASVSEGLQKIRGCRPDAVLFDLSFHKTGSASALKSIMCTLSVPVLLVSQLTEDEIPAAIEALSLGAFDVVGAPGSTALSGKRQSPDEIVRAVRLAVSRWRAEAETGDGGVAKSAIRAHRADSRVSATP